ncbi:kelch-like protein 23 isoform X2 [Chiloscyllium punctatum]|uniref:kelch-like protein 23 isoform X2 n=1 Tax=Chiloscyllium punctatum TaxID=137246 RepID=UPI003B63BD01
MAVKECEPYIYEFKDTYHSAEFLDAFKEFYWNQLFTDITLESFSGQLFHCHKVALAACSTYFKIMFTADMREKATRIIKLPNIDDSILDALVNYVYTSEVLITKQNVQSLLETADLLQFISIKKACENFLIRHLDIDNCLGMHSFSEFHTCKDLERESRRMILSRFEDVSRQDEFLDINKDKLLFILSRENLNVWKKDILLEAIIKWIAYDIKNRIECLKELLKYIKADLDESYLRTALELNGQYLLSSDIKMHSLKCHVLKPNENGNINSQTCKKSTCTMYIVGGYYWHPLSEVHIWNPLTDLWTHGSPMPDHKRESYSVAALGPNIYVTGGYSSDSLEALDTMWMYNSEMNNWTEGSPMLNARYYHCSVVMHGCVYAMGGYRGGAPAREAEFYDPLKRKWISIVNMLKEYGLSSVALNNKIYLVGGQTTITDCYDTEKNEWKQIAQMNERRMECAAVVMNGCIYVTGGYSYSKGIYLESVEKYDPEQDSWEMIGNLPSAMRSHGCVTVYNVEAQL